MTPFKSKTPIQLRFRDLDALGHVNSAVYFSYFELCRVDYFTNRMPDKAGLLGDTSIVVAKIAMEYKQQVVLSDIVFGSVWVSRLGTKSFDMIFSLTKQDDKGNEVEVAQGSTTLVCVDSKSMKSVVVPDVWKNNF
jgi:acyl-CoA thioester hydrolase